MHDELITGAVPAPSMEVARELLVEPEVNRLVVSVRQTDKVHDPHDLVRLAQEVQLAGELIKSRATSRLADIAEQMRILQEKAREVLETAARDDRLHRVACNMQKVMRRCFQESLQVPGRVYHLYEKEDGTEYFSMLSPVEWHDEKKQRAHRGSFRLEYDRSWTPLEDVHAKDDERQRFEQVFRKVANNLALGD